MATPSLQRRIAVQSALYGSAIALLIVVCDAAGLLQPLERWLYDVRAARCQFFTPAPSRQIVFLDIDDYALDTIQRWPWHRSRMAAVLEEVRLAGPKAVGIDVLFSEPQDDRIELRPDGSHVTIAEDAAMERTLRAMGNAFLANSFSIGAAGGEEAALRSAAVAEFAADPRLPAAELVARLQARGAITSEQAVRVEQDFPFIRRAAVRQRIRQLLVDGPVELAQVEAALRGGRDAGTRAAAPPAGAPVLDSTLRSIVAKEYQHVLAETSLRRFSLPAPADDDAAGPAPPDGTFASTPLPQFCDAIAGAGFADYNLFSEAVVRAVPLFVRHDGRLYPQFALAVACRMLDADLTRAQLAGDHVLIPAPGGDLRIPVRSRHSASSGRDVGGILQIPWFGPREWATMFDWPAHRQPAQHYPIDLAWGIVEVRQRLAQNNATVDAAAGILLSELLDRQAAQAYAARKLDPEDFAPRRELAAKVLADLRDLGMNPADADADDLPEDVRFSLRTMAALAAAAEQNAALDVELRQRRAALAEKLGGKAVFIGAVATAMGDFVTTSLHARSPGVVVHGTIANAILNRDFLRVAPGWATVGLTLLFGLLATAITSRLPPARAAGLVILIAAVYFAANGLLLFDRLNVVVDAAAPLVAMAACWGGCMVVRLVVETFERIRLKREAAVIEHEITLARQVQAALIPKELTILRRVESHGWTLAATTTGGDCFDLWKLADGRMGILVADASGHGLGPSIIVSEVRALVRALCDLYAEPQDLLQRVNLRLAEDLDPSRFCTCFVGFLSEDGTLSWGSAGHGPMLWAARREDEPQELHGTAAPLAVSDIWLGDDVVPPLKLEPGGWLAVMSDGIFEAPNLKGELYDVDRVRQVIADHRDAPSEQIVAALRESVHRWQGQPIPADDQTIVFLRCLGAESHTAADPPPTREPATAAEGG